MYLNYLTIIGQLEIAGWHSEYRTEERHTVATLFGEISFNDMETALAALQEFLVIYQHDGIAAMQTLAYAHKVTTKVE